MLLLLPVRGGGPVKLGDRGTGGGSCGCGAPVVVLVEVGGVVVVVVVEEREEIGSPLRGFNGRIILSVAAAPDLLGVLPEVVEAVAVVDDDDDGGITGA